jgi:hypothetical protein
LKAQQAESEQRLAKQHEWQLREIREEQACEIRAVIRQGTVDREEMEAAVKKAKQEIERLKAERDTKEMEIEELRVYTEQRIEEERSRYLGIIERIQ